MEHTADRRYCATSCKVSKITGRWKPHGLVLTTPFIVVGVDVGINKMASGIQGLYSPSVL